METVSYKINMEVIQQYTHFEKMKMNLVEEPILKQIDFLTRFFFLKIFTPDQCTKIINTALNTWKGKESRIWNEEKQNWTENLDYCNTTMFSPSNPDTWLSSTIFDNIKKFNDSNDGHQFDISDMIESPSMMRYMASDVNPNGKSGKYDWHMDIGSGPVPSMRKLSYSILLNAGEYEGGELCFHIGRNEDPHPGQTEKEDCGSMVLFPSYLVHRVLPITKGTRYAIVGWVHGNSFL